MRRRAQRTQPHTNVALHAVGFVRPSSAIPPALCATCWPRTLDCVVHASGVPLAVCANLVGDQLCQGHHGGAALGSRLQAHVPDDGAWPQDDHLLWMLASRPAGLRGAGQVWGCQGQLHPTQKPLLYVLPCRHPQPLSFCAWRVTVRGAHLKWLRWKSKPASVSVLSHASKGMTMRCGSETLLRCTRLHEAPQVLLWQEALQLLGGLRGGCGCGVVGVNQHAHLRKARRQGRKMKPASSRSCGQVCCRLDCTLLLESLLASRESIEQRMHRGCVPGRFAARTCCLQRHPGAQPPPAAQTPARMRQKAP